LLLAAVLRRVDSWPIETPETPLVVYPSFGARAALLAASIAAHAQLCHRGLACGHITSAHLFWQLGSVLTTVAFRWRAV
jgi:hypothetical protein